METTKFDFDTDNLILEFDDTHLYRDLKSAYLMQLEEDAPSDGAAKAIEDYATLYSLGFVDFYFNLHALEKKDQMMFVLNKPS